MHTKGVETVPRGRREQVGRARGRIARPGFDALEGRSLTAVDTGLLDVFDGLRVYTAGLSHAVVSGAQSARLETTLVHAERVYASDDPCRAAQILKRFEAQALALRTGSHAPDAALVTASDHLYAQVEMILNAIGANAGCTGLPPVPSNLHQVETLRITLPDGQTRSIGLDNTERSFVTGFQTSSDRHGHVTGHPVSSSIPTGLFMTVHAEVSTDRRTVALTVDLTERTISSPISTSRVRTPLGPLTIERPEVTTSHVLSTVTVPDGGTALLGGTTTVIEGQSGASTRAENSGLQISVVPRIVILEDPSPLQVQVEVRLVRHNTYT